MKNIMNIGIIGAGVVAERIINAAKEHPRASIKSIYDTNKERLKEVTQKYDIESIDSYKSLLEDKEIDIIYLAVPPKYHHPIALDIFNSGKHFICEKPLANSTEEAKSMYELAEKKNMVCAMNFPTMYTKAYEKIEELLKEDFIGNLVRVEFQGYFTNWPRLWQQNNWISTREQGGFVREVITHYIQITQRLFGDIENIVSFTEYPTDPAKSETSIIAKGEVNGKQILINAITDIGMEEDLSFKIFGSKGTMYLNNWRELWVSGENGKMEKLEIEETSNLVGLLDNVFKAIDGKESNIVNFYEGYKTHKIVEKLLEGN
jgi:predicted dehydrogenase